MKWLYCLLLFLIGGCASTPYFKSPNDVYKKKVVLYLRNKPPVSGILTIPFEENFNLPPTNQAQLRFIPEGKLEEEQIDLKEIIGYSIDKNYYALKSLYLFTHNTEHLLFAQRLTPEDSRIQLYELEETGKGNATGENQRSYFISLSSYSQYETVNTHSNRLIPDFDQKMPEWVADCPILAEKIRNKENGYFIPLLSFNTFKHKEVMMRIINEYNRCK